MLKLDRGVGLYISSIFFVIEPLSDAGRAGRTGTARGASSWTWPQVSCNGGSGGEGLVDLTTCTVGMTLGLTLWASATVERLSKGLGDWAG